MHAILIILLYTCCQGISLTFSLHYAILYKKRFTLKAVALRNHDAFLFFDNYSRKKSTWYAFLD